MTSQNDDILEILNQIIDSGIAETTHSPKPSPPRTIETHAQIQKLPKPVDSTIIPGANQQRKFNELLAEFEIIKKQQQQDKQASQRLRLQYAVTKKKLQMATISLESVIEENEALKQSLAPPEPITQLPELIKAITLITRLHQETQAEHLELHHQHQHSIHKVKQLASELHLLKTEHETLTQSHQQATQEIDILRSSANTAERRSHQLSEDQEALQEDLQRLREQIGKKDNEIDRLQQSLQNPPTSPAEHELKKENDALKAELKTVLGEFQNQTDSLDQLADKLVDIQSFESEFKQQKNNLHAEIEALHAALSEVTIVNAQPEPLKQPTHPQLQKLQTTIDTLEEELRALHVKLAPTNTTPTIEKFKPPFDAFDESGQQKAIGEILLDAEIITETQLFNALVEQNKQTNRRLGSLLIEKDLIQEDTVAKVLASQLRVEYLDLAGITIPDDVCSTLNGRLASHHMCIPIRKANNQLTIAMANPFDTLAREDIERETGMDIELAVAPSFDISAAIVQHYGTDYASQSKPLTTPHSRNHPRSPQQ